MSEIVWDKVNTNVIKFAFIFILIDSSASSQILAIQETNSPSVDFLGKYGPNFVVSESNKGKESLSHSLTISTYDDDLKIVNSTDLKNIDYSDNQCILIDSAVYVTQMELEGQQRKYFIRNIVIPGGINKESGTEIFSMNAYKENFKLQSESYEFFFRISASGKRVLFLYENDFKEKYKNEVKFRTFYGGDSLSDIKILKIPYSCKLSQTRGYVYNDLNGEKVFILVSVFDKPSGRKKEVVRTILYEFNIETSHVREIDIPIDSDYGSCKITYCDGKLLLAFLTKDEDESAVTGFKFVVFDDSLLSLNALNLDTLLSTKWKFSYKLSTPTTNTWDLLKGSRDTYRIRSLDLLGQSKIIAVVEKNNREVVSSGGGMPMANGTGMGFGGGGGFGSGKVTYMADDLLVTGFDILSGQLFTKEIKKKQQFDRSTYISFLLFKKGMNAQLLFTDTDEGNTDVFTSYYKVNSYLIGDSVIKVSENNFTNDMFKAERKYRFQTKSTLKLNDDTYVIAATVKGKESYLLKIKLSDLD